MKIKHAERQKGKTSDIFWMAYENQPSVILVPDQHFKDILLKEYDDILHSKYGDADVMVEVFSKYPHSGIGQHQRNIFIDDLDICLNIMFGQKVAVGSITDRLCERAEKDGFYPAPKMIDGKLRCPGFIHSMNLSVTPYCECCAYQYGHPQDKIWSEK